MKSCPTCNRTYADDTLTFCLVDGSILSAPYDPQIKQPYPLRQTEPPPTEIFHSTHEPADTISSSQLQPTIQTSPLIYTADSKQSQPIKKGVSKRQLAVGIAVFLIMSAGVVIMLSRGRWLGSRNSTDKKTEAIPEVSNTNTMTTPTLSATPQSTPSPESTPSPAAKLDVAGTWVGISDKSPATLIINSGENDSYEGIQIVSGRSKVQMAISVYVNSATRHITFKETRLIKGSGWNLGTNNGSISSDGKKMSGTAKDVKGKKSSWSFSRK